MSSSDGRWAELSSQNERIMQVDELGSGSPVHASPAARTQWAELSSQSERLVGDADPSLTLAIPRQGTTGLRLVAGAA